MKIILTNTEMIEAAKMELKMSSFFGAAKAYSPDSVIFSNAYTKLKTIEDDTDGIKVTMIGNTVEIEIVEEMILDIVSFAGGAISSIGGALFGLAQTGKLLDSKWSKKKTVK